jgi:tripartite-type tricarboxylate transporter receptor subunit TctC
VLRRLLPAAAGAGAGLSGEADPLIVPYGAGGARISSAACRPEAQRAAAQQVVVENRPGAASLLGTEMAARSAPDGYTLLLADSGFTINPVSTATSSTTRSRILDPVSVVAETPYLLVVNPGLPLRGSLREFLPGEADHGQHQHRLGAAAAAGRTFQGTAQAARGINLTHVPYKSAGAAVADVVGGLSQSTLSLAARGAAARQSRKAAACSAAASARRSALYRRDVPTFAESARRMAEW